MTSISRAAILNPRPLCQLADCRVTTAGSIARYWPFVNRQTSCEILINVINAPPFELQGVVGTHFWPLKSPPLLASPCWLEGGKNSHYRKSSFSNNATEPLHGTSFLPFPPLFFRLTRNFFVLPLPCGI